MPRNVFEKTLWDQRRALPVWMFYVAAVAAMYAGFYPSYRQPALVDALKGLPAGVQAAFSIGDMSSPAGYAQSTVFGLVVTILVILFAVTTGTRAIAGDEESGTLDLLLAHPVSRAQVVLQRFAALVVATSAVGAVTLLALLAVSRPARLAIGAGNLAAMVLHLVLLGLCFGALALALGGVFGRRSPVYMVTAAAGVLTYFANTLAPRVDALAWLRWLSPFHYYAGGQPLRHGLQLGDAGVLIALTLLLVAAGTVAFNRRDVAV